MPTIETRKDKNQKITGYRAKVRVKGYPPETATFKRKTDAKEWAQRVESEIKEGKYFPSKKAKKYTVANVIDKYLEHLNLKNTNRYKDVKPLLEWWKSYLHGKTLSSFTSEDVINGQKALISRQKQRRNANGEYQNLSPSTVNRYMVALHTAIQFGIKPLKLISINPVGDVEKLKEPPGRIRFLSKDELNNILSACKASKNKYLYVMLLVGISSGARRSEIQYMKWADVNEGATLITLPKTKNGEVRSAHITGLASEIIKKMRDVRGDNIFLFQSPNAPEKPIDFESAWRIALKRANLKDFHFHDSRHTCASYLAMNGASTLVLKEALGHKSLAMVQRYAHLTQEHTSDMMKRMTERVFGDVKI